jgi:hypothetical protein
MGVIHVVPPQKKDCQASLIPVKFRLRTKKISKGISIVIRPNTYARYGAIFE